MGVWVNECVGVWVSGGIKEVSNGHRGRPFCGVVESIRVASAGLGWGDECKGVGEGMSVRVWVRG